MISQVFVTGNKTYYYILSPDLQISIRYRHVENRA